MWSRGTEPKLVMRCRKTFCKMFICLNSGSGCCSATHWCETKRAFPLSMSKMTRSPRTCITRLMCKSDFTVLGWPPRNKCKSYVRSYALYYSARSIARDYVDVQVPKCFFLAAPIVVAHPLPKQGLVFQKVDVAHVAGGAMFDLSENLYARSCRCNRARFRTQIPCSVCVELRCIWEYTLARFCSQGGCMDLQLPWHPPDIPPTSTSLQSAELPPKTLRSISRHQKNNQSVCSILIFPQIISYSCEDLIRVVLTCTALCQSPEQRVKVIHHTRITNTNRCP